MQLRFLAGFALGHLSLLSIVSTVLWFLKKQAPAHSIIPKLEILRVVLFWYLLSISFTLWNKLFLVGLPGFSLMGFPYPILVTVVHMFVKLALTRAVNLSRPIELQVKPLPCGKAMRSTVPIGICTSLDVAFSNLAFLFISVSYYTILKSGALLWILLWALLLRLEVLSWQVVLICGIISSGVGLASFGEVDFSFSGFVLVQLACCLSGLRWSLTQQHLQDEAQGTQQQDSFATLYHISPASAFTCLPIFILICFILLVGGCLSFLLILAEIKLVELSSSLNLGVCGVIKELTTVLMSMVVLHDQVSVLNAIGLWLTILGLMWYRRYQITLGRSVQPAGIQMARAVNANGPGSYVSIGSRAGDPWLEVNGVIVDEDALTPVPNTAASETKLIDD